MANRITAFLAHEFRHMLPPTIFFLVSLNLLVLTVALLSDDHELSAISHLSASIGALLVGKAFLLADKLSLIDRHIDRPLLHGALWSAFYYFLITFALHLAERLISAAAGGKGFLFRARAEVASFDWSLFLAVEIWLALLLIVYSVIRSTVTAIGPARVREMLLTRPSSADL